MNDSSDERYREELLGHFSNAVKQVQMEQMSKEGIDSSGMLEAFITNDSPSGRILCSCLEMIFSHGLKHEEYGIWEIVRYFCRSDVIRTIEHLRHVKTDKGRGRAWIFLTLNDKELEGYLQSFQMDLSHMYKYYNRSAMICGTQITIIQTLISGLDFITFRLNMDMPYLDFRITNTTVASRSNSTVSKQKTTHNGNRGSIVHVDTTAISKTGQKAVDYVKGIWSREGTTREKSIKCVNTRTVVAVNANRSTMQARKYCPDCKNHSQLVCLCIRENSKPLDTGTSMLSANTKILESALNGGSGDLREYESENVASGVLNSSVPYSKERANPFNRRFDEFGTKFHRFDRDILIADAPIEVIRKPVKRRHKISDCASDISTKSDNITSRTRTNSIVSDRAADYSKRHGSVGDLCLSDPLIGFDPRPDISEDAATQKIGENGALDFQSDSCDLKNVSDSSQAITHNPLGATHISEVVAHSPLVVTHNSEGVTHNPLGATHNSEGVTERCYNELTQTNKTEYVISSQGSLANGILEISDNSGEGTAILSTQISSNYNANMECVPCDDISKDSTLIGDKTTVEMKAGGDLNTDDILRLENNKDGDVVSGYENGLKMHQEDISDLQTEAENEQKIGSTAEKNLNDKSTNLGISGGSYDIANQAMYPTSENNNSDKLSKSEVESSSPEERQEIRRSRGMRRYRSESEHLLNAWTKQEVERLRAEIQTKLKPSRDRLEKVRKSIAEKNLYQGGGGSFQHDSSFMMDRDSETSSSSRPLFDDSSDDVTEHDVSSISQDADSQFDGDLNLRGNESAILLSMSSSSLPGTFSRFKSSTPISVGKFDIPHKAVANIDNTLRLYLMLEILADENEEVIKLFHVSTGHSEGNWSPLYLLFSDSFLYFLRSGDGNCPYQTEHAVSYEDLDYISVGYNSQTMEFAFYKNKSRSSKTNKKTRGRVRTKLTIDTTDKDLTDSIISTLTRALVIFTRQQSVIKVCPPIFHDAKEHQISLIKYLRSEGFTGDIQLYQLVHWEDPDFATGASVSKISLEGTLKYRAQSFWGSSQRSAYFVLSGGVLYQYSGKDSEKPEGSYELTGNNCVGCKRLRSNSPTNSCLEFEIDFSDGSKLELCGFSDIEVTEWLQCLCMIVSLDQSFMIDREAPTEGMVMNMLNHDALVPCSLIIADEALLLCHEDRHTGFCRTLAKAALQDISAINIDRKKSFVCEVVVAVPSNQSQKLKWGIFFPCEGPLEAFLSVINSFSKAPTLNDKGDDSPLAHYFEARTLLDNRWTRTNNLLKGRSGSVENYTFL